MSSYRDERAALQERVEVLEEDLREARGKAEQVDALGKDVAAKEKEIAKLKARLEKHEGPRTPNAQRAAPAVAVGMAVLVAAGGAGVFLVLKKPAPQPDQTVATAVPSEDMQGLPEPCAAYFRQIESCVAKHPEMKPLRENAPQMAEGFKTGLANPQSREAVLGACAQSLKALQDACK